MFICFILILSLLLAFIIAPKINANKKFLVCFSVITALINTLLLFYIFEASSRAVIENANVYSEDFVKGVLALSEYLDLYKHIFAFNILCAFAIGLMSRK